MQDFATARRMMVDGQVRPADVTDLRLIDAMADLPRERFVPAASAGLAYLDIDLPVHATATASSRRMLKPMVLARMIHACDIGPEDTVLDVGGLTGYSSAVMAALAGSVVSLDEDAELSRHAKANCESLGIVNVTVATGPLTAGWPAAAPYDVILVNGAIEVEPQALFDQLKDGGCLVTIVGSGPATKTTIYRRSGSDVSGRPIFDAHAALLPGFMKVPAFVF